MSTAPTHAACRRRLFAPEVVQTSSMDCGPAALKCLLEGHGVPVGYGRLREACQTDVDGTSIDTIEIVAGQLGLAVEQVMVPVDHMLASGNGMLPALVVVRHADEAVHFVVVWRRFGRWLQVMDPAIGRRWVRASRFRDDIHRHRLRVDAAAWRTWAEGTEFQQALLCRMALLRVRALAAQALVDRALADAGWQGAARLDAAVRLAQSLHDAGGLAAGDETERFVAALCAAKPDEAPIPATYASVRPIAGGAPDALELHGAVLLRVAGRRDTRTVPEASPPLSRELQAALNEPPVRLVPALWGLIREDGPLAPLALIGAVAVAAGAVVLEAVLLRGVFDAGTLLVTAHQRLAGAAGLLLFLAVLMAIELPIVHETLRLGRRLELRLRIALLRKLPLLNDRYFQSRPLSDMADRAHGLQATRGLAALGFGLVRTACELALTFAGIAFVAPQCMGIALLLVTAAAALPCLAQPLLNERDLRVRSLAGALNGYYLDALLGLFAVRAHRAERNVARQHEGLLVDWAGALRGWIALAMLAQGAQTVVCTALAAWLLMDHYARSGGIGGADLLLAFWTLKLSALGGRLAALGQQLPPQRNALLRLMEPLAAPAEPGTLEAAEPEHGGTVAVRIEAGNVVAAGQPLLRDLNLDVRAGEHVAIVGTSGAGKSTLLGLLLGWHRLATGRLMIDERELDAPLLRNLRQRTAWVDPGVQLWNASFLDNLGYASDAHDLARTSAVLQTARLSGVLERLPEGLQTLLGEGGALLSGGEGQRLRLGRALLASGTRLVLLDEPFRGLDRGQRRQLLAEARDWWRDTTLLCVTHDVAETAGFDRVLVVEHGRIVEDGAPRELSAGATRYRELLDAERRVGQLLWRSTAWRRLQVQDGRVVASEEHP